VCRWDIPEKPRVNFAKVMGLKNRELERLSKLYRGNLEKAGVTFIEGRGKVTGPHGVEVNGKDYKVIINYTNVCVCSSFIGHTSRAS
jgi:pyruvate/2-oxoglutarate dehydrogenase complex dihydrolipoamide dehydrogenase (E3) component